MLALDRRRLTATVTRRANALALSRAPVWLVFACVIALPLVAAFTERVFFSDLSTYLLSMLRNQDFAIVEPQREYSQYIRQSPVILVLDLGLTDLHTLIKLDSFSLAFFPALAWLLALNAVRGDSLFWPFVMMFAFVHLNVNLSPGEFGFAYGLAALCMALLLRSKPLSRLDGALLLVSAAILIKTYETMALLSPLLALMAGLRWLGLIPSPDATRRDSGMAGGILAAAVMLFLVSGAFSAWWIVNPRSASNLSGASELHNLFLPQFALSFAVAGAYGLLLLLGHQRRVASLAICVAAAGGLLLLYPGFWAHWSWYSLVKAWVAIPMFGFGLVMLVTVLLQNKEAGRLLPGWLARPLILRERAMPSAGPFLAAIPLCLMLLLLGVELRHSYNSHVYHDRFRQEVDSRTGFVRAEDTSVLDGRFGWTWLLPVTSLLLRDDVSKAIILPPEDYRGFQLFDPRVSLPDLSRYYR